MVGPSGRFSISNSTRCVGFSFFTPGVRIADWWTKSAGPSMSG